MSIRFGSIRLDTLVRQLWDEHLAGLDKLTVISKKWRSGYWKNWYRDLVVDMDETDVTEDLDRPECDKREEEIESSDFEQLWYNAGSPPLADDDMGEHPAEYHKDTPGGLSKPKPPDASGATSASIYLPEVLPKACRKYERFHGRNP